MLLVETYLGVTLDKGIGLFAKNDIPKGTVYWVRNEIFDKIISNDEAATLGDLVLEYLNVHACLEVNNKWYICTDNGKFANHSGRPNSVDHFDENGLIKYSTVSRDIRADEEIVCDYTKLCLTCKDGVNFEDMVS